MTNPEGTQPTAEEIDQAAKVLSKLERGFLPFEVFHQVARLAVTPIVEVVPVRASEAGTEVLLTRRDENDPVWPGMLHTAGTVVRASDGEGTGYEDAIHRIYNGELAGTEIGEPVFVENILHDSGRGMESAQVFFAEVVGEPARGEFSDAEHLPEDVVQSQLEFIQHAVRRFQELRSQR